MLNRTLSAAEAANQLGISVLTLYDWLSQSDAGTFMLRGQQVTIEYFQGGRRGQGRIRVQQSEVARLLNLMKVRPNPRAVRRSPRPKQSQSHITAKLGRPDD